MLSGSEASVGGLYCFRLIGKDRALKNSPQLYLYTLIGMTLKQI